MIAATIIPIVGSNGDPARAVELASMLALLVGAITIVAGTARLGFIADLLSKPTQIGYMNGLALTILVSQLPKLFGFSVEGDKLIDEARGFVNGLADGDTVGAALAVGAVSLALILVLQRLVPKVPGVLVAVLFAIAASGAFDLADHGVKLVGSLPEGFPPLTVPTHFDDAPLLIAGALGIALVSLTDTISTSSAFAARTGQEVNGNGEMVGIGAANVASSLFQGFPVSTSGSRTAVAEQAGAKTQVTGLVGAGAIILMLVLVPGLLRNLPQSVLGAVVIAASLSLADLPGTRRLWKQRRTEFLLSIAAFLGVALLGVLPGIGIAVALSILNIFRRAWWPYQTTLGRVSHMSGLHDRRLHPEGETLPGLEVFRFDAPLFFANADVLRDDLTAAIDAADPPARWVVLDLESVSDVDSTATETLLELVDDLSARGIGLALARLKAPVAEYLEGAGLFQVIGRDQVYLEVSDAVSALQTTIAADSGITTDGDTSGRPSPAGGGQA
jgi:high affinity sulfate transporter 1